MVCIYTCLHFKYLLANIPDFKLRDGYLKKVSKISKVKKMLVCGPHGSIFACLEGFTIIFTCLIEISIENSSNKNFRCTSYYWVITQIWMKISFFSNLLILLKIRDWWIFNVPIYVCKYCGFHFFSRNWVRILLKCLRFHFGVSVWNPAN